MTSDDNFLTWCKQSKIQDENSRQRLAHRAYKAGRAYVYECEIEKLQKENKILMEAVSFYSDKRLTIIYNKIFCTSDPRLISVDPLTGINKGVTMFEKGKKARQALDKIKEIRGG